jgi:hypothetical protein
VGGNKMRLEKIALLGTERFSFFSTHYYGDEIKWHMIGRKCDEK